MPRSFSTSISLLDKDYAVMERLMAELGTRNRSELVRTLMWERIKEPVPGREPATGAADPAIIGTQVAACVREKIAEMAGVQEPAGADYPGMGVAGYELALIIAQNHMTEILAGTIPMVYDDAHAAGLDPHGQNAWGLYTVALPGFFKVALELDKPPAVDMRYDPLELVDGQHAGAVKGEVVSSSQVYPDNDTAMYTKLVVRAGRQEVPVLVPAGLGGGDVAVGATVYAGGVFTVIRQKVVMRACKCAVVRPDGFEAIYGLLERWGVDEQAADGVIHVLRRCHGGRATEYADVFGRYVEIDQESEREMLMLKIPGGRLRLQWGDVRSKPPGLEAIQECTKLWSRVFGRIGPDDIIQDAKV